MKNLASCFLTAEIPWLFLPVHFDQTISDYLLTELIVTLFHQKKTSIQMFCFMILDFICFLNFPMNLCSLQLDTKFMWITSLSPSIVFMVLIHSLSCHSLLSEFQTHLSFVLLLHYITELWSWVIYIVYIVLGSLHCFAHSWATEYFLYKKINSSYLQL